MSEVRNFSAAYRMALPVCEVGEVMNWGSSYGWSGPADRSNLISATLMERTSVEGIRLVKGILIALGEY